MKDVSPKPSLRISHIVYGRLSSGNRVTYLLDPNGMGNERAVPESVVLARWRKRKFPGYIFSGSRLSSTIWRAVIGAFGSDAKIICNLSQDEITQTIESKRLILNNNGFLKLPNADVLHAIFMICSSIRLQKIIDRHQSVDHHGKSGVPDLFLFARSTVNKKTLMGRFVEVKKPEELLSPVQREEILFLNLLGLNARVLRLIERKSPNL